MTLLSKHTQITVTCLSLCCFSLKKVGHRWQIELQVRCPTQDFPATYFGFTGYLYELRHINASRLVSRTTIPHIRITWQSR